MGNALIERKTALLYANSRQYKLLLQKTNDFIATTLAKFEAKSYVACSFGKDSAVMLHLLLNHSKKIPVVFVYYPETEIIDNYEEVIPLWGDINLHKIYLDVGILAEVNEKDVIPNLARENGFTLGFVGIRAQESNARRITLSKCGMLYHYKNTDIWRACPLAWWKLEDIAAYIFSNEMPMLKSYISHGIQTRTTTGIAPDDFGFRSAQLRRLKDNNISNYNNILSKYPELANYV